MHHSRRHLVVCASFAFFCGALVLFLSSRLAFIRSAETKVFSLFSSVTHADYSIRDGDGSATTPFIIGKLGPPATTEVPFIIQTNDRPETNFDSFPQTPSDYAGLIDTLRGQSVKSLLFSAPLQWDDADPFAIIALEKQSTALDRCIMSAPLTRSAQGGEMPSAFVRASLPIAGIHGELRSLPKINRLALPNNFLGKEKTWAGFSAIETEDIPPQRAFLLARWNDRLVFSTTLLGLIVHERCELSELQIIPGKMIRFPRYGKIIPIDEYGCLSLTNRSTLPAALLADEIDRPEKKQLEIISRHSSPVCLIDESKMTPRAESQRTNIALQELYQSPSIVDHIRFLRLPTWIEWMLLLTFSALCSLMLTWKIWQRIMIGVSCLALVLLAMHLADTWLPFLPCVVAFASIFLSDCAQRVLPLNESVLVFLPPSSAPETREVIKAAPVKVALKKATPAKEKSPKIIKEKIPKAAKEPQPAKEEKVKEVKPKPVEKPQAPVDKKTTTRVKKTATAARKKAKKKS